MVYFIQTYLISLLETTCCVIFFEMFGFGDEEKQTESFMRYIFIFLLSVLSYIIVVLMNNFFVMKQIVVVVLTAFIMLYYMKWEFGKSLVVSTFFQSVLLIADFLTFVINTSLLQASAVENETTNLLIIMLSKAVLFILILFFNNFYRHNDTKYIRERDWLAFWIMPLFSIAIIAALLKKAEFIDEANLGTFSWALAFGLVCINILLFYLMQNIGKREYLLREKTLIEMETRNQLRLYEMISENAGRQRALSHEYKNQLLSIQGLLKAKEYDRLREYLEKASGKVLHDMDYIDTNNAFINAVLNEKYQEAIEKRIIMVCRINDLSGVKMDSSDLILLVSNLLNNAIEACEKCNENRIIIVNDINFFT